MYKKSVGTQEEEQTFPTSVSGGEGGVCGERLIEHVVVVIFFCVELVKVLDLLLAPARPVPGRSLGGHRAVVFIVVRRCFLRFLHRERFVVSM